MQCKHSACTVLPAPCQILAISIHETAADALFLYFMLQIRYISKNRQSGALFVCLCVCVYVIIAVDMLAINSPVEVSPGNDILLYCTSVKV